MLTLLLVSLVFPQSFPYLFLCHVPFRAHDLFLHALSLQMEIREIVVWLHY